MDPDAKRAAAEARRAKILARGRDRLAQITGSVSQEAQPQQQQEAPTAAAQPASAGLSSAEQPPLPPAAAELSPAPAPETAPLATAFTAALKESQSVASNLSEASSLVRQRKGGTAATGDRWTAYGAPAAAAPRPRRSAAAAPPVSLAETLAAAAGSTALLRLAAAVLLAALTAAAALRSTAGPSADHQPAGWHLAAWDAAVEAWAQQQQRLPPLVSIAVLDAGIVAAAFLLLRSQPALVRRQAGGPAPGLLMRAAALVPGLQDGLALLVAWQRAAAGVMDDAAMFIVALVAANLAPLAWAGVHGS